MTIYDIVRPRGWLVLELMQGTLLDATRGQPIDLDCSAVGADRLAAGAVAAARQRRAARRHQAERTCWSTGWAGSSWAISAWPAAWPATRAATSRGRRGTWPRSWSRRSSAPSAPPATCIRSASRPTSCCAARSNSRTALSGPGRLRPRQADRLDDVARRGRPPLAAGRVGARRRARRPGPRHRPADVKGPVAALPLGRAGPGRPAQRQAAARRDNRKTTVPPTKAGRSSSGGWWPAWRLVASLLVSMLVAGHADGQQTASARAAAARGHSRRRADAAARAADADHRASRATSARRSSSSGTNDRVLLNDKPGLLRDLREADQVTIQTLKDEQGRPVAGDLGVAAARGSRHGRAPHGRRWRAGRRAGRAGRRAEAGRRARRRRSSSTARATHSGQPLTLADLAAGDRVAVAAFSPAIRTGRRLQIAGLRVVAGQGVVRAIDSETRRSLDRRRPGRRAPRSPSGGSAERLEVTLNGRRVLDDRLLTPADLRAGRPRVVPARRQARQHRRPAAVRRQRHDSRPSATTCGR